MEGLTEPDADDAADDGRSEEEDSGGDATLRRTISRPMLLMLVVGDVLGAGIYALVGEVGGRAGGAIWAAFLLALGLALLTAFAYAELVTKYPQAAGAALYVNKAWGKPFLTFLVAFAVMASGLTSAATLARAVGGDYLSDFVTAPTVLVGLAFITLVALINFRGISESVKLNVVLTVIELTGLVIVVVVGVAAIAEGGADVDTGRALELGGDGSVVTALLGGAGLAFFALIGFEDSVNLAEEAKDPRRDYPLALFGGLAIAGLLYLMVTVVASIVVPTDRLAASDGPLLEVVAAGPWSLPDRLFSAIALCALANGALINMVMASRIVYGMAREDILPKPLGWVHAGRRTPWVAIVATTAIAMVLIASGELDDLADTTVLLLLLVFATVNIAVLVLKRDQVSHDHFRVPAFIPVVGAAVSLGLMATKSFGVFARTGALLALGIVLSGLTWWFKGRHAAPGGSETPTEADPGDEAT